MIVFLGNAGKLPEDAGWEMALLYLVVVVGCFFLFFVPTVWTLIWITLVLSTGIDYAEGLLFCYKMCGVGLIGCVIAAAIRTIYDEYKIKKQK